MKNHFEHNSEAHGIKGKFLWPVSDALEVRPQVKLLPSGGLRQDRIDNYNFNDLVKYGRGYSEVSGSPNVETLDGKPVPADNNLAMTVIEDFNLLEVVEVRKMVSRITTRYFHGTTDVEIVLAGTRFEGFRILGQEVIVKLATDLFLENPTHGHVRKAHTGGAFSDRFNLLSGGKALPEKQDATYELTLVEEILVPNPTSEFTVTGNMIDIPHVGKLYLAELTVAPYSKSLTMIRWDLGCPAGGDGTIGGTQTGGVPNP
jgi:hypothetical protein